jgi:hypothetical protein
MLFEQEVADNDTIFIALLAFDEDAAKDWEKRPQWMDQIALEVGKQGIAQAAAGNLTAAVIMGAAVGVYYGFSWMMGRDKDDELARKELTLPALGDPSRPVEMMDWDFKGGGGWWSSWNYKVKLRISRSITKMVAKVTQPSQIFYGEPTNVAVSAHDYVTNLPVPGKVYFVTEKEEEVGSTNTSIAYTFVKATHGKVSANGYPDTNFSIPL